MKMMAIIRNELWQRRWSLLWWSVGIIGFLILNLAVYPSFKGQAAELDKTLRQMPESLRALFSDTGDFLSPAGFLSSQIYYLMLPLLLGVLSIGMGASLISREEQRGTLELLLARPISRSKLLISKMLAGVIILTGIGLAVAIVMVIGVRIAGIDVSRKGVLLATLLSVILAGLFGAISFMFGALGRPARAASLGIASLFAIGSYIISSLDTTVRWLEWPAKLLPYHYYRPGDIVTGTSTGVPAMIGFGVAILILGIIAWAGFRRRDIG